MSSWRGGRGNIIHKRVHPLSYDLVATTFDYVPIEVWKEILGLESVGQGITRILLTLNWWEMKLNGFLTLVYFGKEGCNL